MPPKSILSPPPAAALSQFVHTVAFYETDAMGIVHHSNYVRFLELARVRFLAEHDQPYAEYVAQGYHVPVTRVEVAYKRACKFADEIVIKCWLAWAQRASLGFAYRLEVSGALVATATSDHAVTRHDGRPVRMPEHMHDRLHAWLGQGSEGQRSATRSLGQ
jgi:acyl-CoA thioester hydrolase